MPFLGLRVESNVLYQLINDTNYNNPTIPKKVEKKSHTYYGFNFNVTHIFLEAYKYECQNYICYKYGRT